MNKKGSSLLEVVVVLAIVSLTMLSIMALLIRASTAIKDAEIQEAANGILLKSIEAIKSQNDIAIVGFDPVNFATGLTYRFRLGDSSGGNNLEFVDLPTTPNTCETSFPFYVADAVGMRACLVIEVIPRQNSTGGRFYEVNSVVIYSLSRNLNNFAIQNLKTFRYGKFIPV